MLELLRQFLHCKPIRPIRVVLRSGDRYDITDPDRVAIGKSQVHVVRPGQMAHLDEADIELVYQPRLR